MIRAITGDCDENASATNTERPGSAGSVYMRPPGSSDRDTLEPVAVPPVK